MAARRTSASSTWTARGSRNGRVFAENFAPGMTDGMRTDADGNVWCSMGWADPAEDGVRCYAPDGDLIGKIHLPEGCANLCFGGKKRNRLFMTREHVGLRAAPEHHGRAAAMSRFLAATLTFGTAERSCLRRDDPARGPGPRNDHEGTHGTSHAA